MRDARKSLVEEATAVADGALPSSAAPKKKPKGKGRGLNPPAQE